MPIFFTILLENVDTILPSTSEPYCVNKFYTDFITVFYYGSTRALQPVATLAIAISLAGILSD